MKNLMINSQEVRFLQIEPTTRCNFKCKFCRTHHMESGDLPWDIFVKVLDSLANLEHLKIQGQGEPLLHPQFFEMVSLAKSRGIKVSTITNGSLFSAPNIAQILDSKLDHILVSIESPLLSEFKEIRGGSLEKVTAGIQNLLKARQESGLKLPTVGFALTVMRKNKHLLKEVANLYQQLQMDGGIMMQFLSEMDSYTEIYESDTLGATLSPLEKVFAYAQYQKIIQSNEHSKSNHTNFYEELYQVPYKHQNGIFSLSTHALNSCPWLENALYVDRQGFAMGCGLIQEADKHTFGRISEHELEEILVNRQILSDQIQSGQVPPSCRHCFVAEAIAAKQAKLKATL